MERVTPTGPGPANAAPGDEPSLDSWGFRDTRFTFTPTGSVTLTGKRYALSGAELPDLLPWIREALGGDIGPHARHPSTYPGPVPPPVTNAAFLAELRATLPSDAVTDDDRLRLRHGHGHTLGAIYAVRYGAFDRVPDLVVYPSSAAEVEKLLELAARHQVCLVPYGGGTNVTDALKCPANETRMIVSVDMSRMNRILWIDAENRMAAIEAGAVGRDIAAQLAAAGFTMGHEPDSVEFSTLGGWIATNASGMKKNRYGNIEDLVLEVGVVTANGASRGHPDGKNEAPQLPVPRESIGIDPRQWIFGSEGMLGIITHAVVKIFPLPEMQQYGSVAFPNFEAGFAFLRDLTREGPVPASVRLVDNLQFQFSQKLKPRAAGLAAWKRRAEKWYITRVKGFDPQQMVACTLVHEGSARQVADEVVAVRRIAARHGGIGAGAENGRKGYELTFGIAYFRDFVLDLNVVGESFETSVPWSRALALCDRVKERVRAEFAALGLPGKPFITCRITQLYQTGVAVYFYLGFWHQGVAAPDAAYAELEHAARDEILKAGGSLSHHHGIGKIRRDFLPRVQSPAALEWVGAVKRAVDPANIFGIANQ